MRLYLSPIERISYGPGAIARVPRYLKSRFNPGGIDSVWSMMDFGVSREIAIVAVPDNVSIQKADVMLLAKRWGESTRDGVTGYLRSAGISDLYIDNAVDYRDMFQRVAGMALAYQSAGDDDNTTIELQDPSKWIARNIRFGNVGGLGPLDIPGFIAEQESLSWRFVDRRGVRWKIDGIEWVSEIGERVPVIAGGALPFTDAFTTGTSQALTSYSTNWTNNNNSFWVDATADAVRANVDDECLCHVNSETFGADHYGEGTIDSDITGWYIGVASRCHASQAKGYGFYGTQGGDNYLFKLNGGAWTQLGSGGSGPFDTDDVVYLESVSTTHTPKINGVTTGTPGAQTDSSYSTGSPGLSGYGNEAHYITFFTGDDVGGGPVTENVSVTLAGYAGIAEAGGSVGGGSVSFTSYPAIGQSAGAVADGSVGLNAIATIAEDAGLSIGVALSLSAIAVISSAGDAIGDGSVQIKAIPAISQLAGAIADADAVFDAIATISSSGEAVALADVVINAISTIAVDGVFAVGVDVLLDASGGIAISGVADSGSSLSLTVYPSILESGQADALSDVVINSIATIVQIGETVAGGSVNVDATLGIGAGITISADAIGGGLVQINAIPAISSSGDAVADGSVDLNAIPVIDLLAEAIADAGVPLGYIATIEVGTGFVIELTPANRRYGINAEDRNYAINYEDRLFAINAEDRTYVINRDD